MSQTKAQLIDTLVASLLPASDSSVDIGSNGVRFANGYFDTLYGDGSNLTGVTSTTINNNADNRVITGSGSANTLNGESSLLFDGSMLTVNGVRVGKGANSVSNNTALGENALDDAVTGDNNTAIGKNTLTANTSGYDNVAVGLDALKVNTTGRS